MQEIQESKYSGNTSNERDGNQNTAENNQGISDGRDSKKR